EWHKNRRVTTVEPSDERTARRTEFKHYEFPAGAQNAPNFNQAGEGIVYVPNTEANRHEIACSVADWQRHSIGTRKRNIIVGGPGAMRLCRREGKHLGDKIDT